MLPFYQIKANVQNAYIAGSGDGIVSVGGKPSAQHIWLFDAQSLQLVRHATSLPNGHYLITGLDPDKEYLVVCRNHERQYEPFCWDYVRPATDLSLDEQLTLWQSWQS